MSVTSVGGATRAGEGSLTDSSYYLCFQAKLILEPTGEVAYATMAIARNVRNLPYMVEHLATGEEENSNQAQGSPEISVLDNWQDVGRQDREERNSTHHCGDCEDETHVVDRTD